MKTDRQPWRNRGDLNLSEGSSILTPLHGVTAICRGSMTGKVLIRQLNGKTGIGWNLNTPSWNSAKASLPYAYTKYTKFHVATTEHRITDTEKVLKYTFTKTGTWWELNTHCSGGWRYNHITRIKPFAKYPNFGDVTGRSRGGMAGKFLTRQLNEKTESGWDLNTRPLNTVKVTLHYALLCFHQVHQVLCRCCRASRHRYRRSTAIYIDKYWDRVRFEPTPVG